MSRVHCKSTSFAITDLLEIEFDDCARAPASFGLRERGASHRFGAMPRSRAGSDVAADLIQISGDSFKDVNLSGEDSFEVDMVFTNPNGSTVVMKPDGHRMNKMCLHVLCVSLYVC